MSALSIARDGKTPFILAANPVFITSSLDFRTGARITFEVMKADESYLSDLIGKRDYYSFDGGTPFWGELLSIEPGGSTHPGLSLLRHKPVLHGVLMVLGEEVGRH